MQNFKIFVTGHKGFETLLFHELRALLQADEAALQKIYGGVEINAGITAVYRVCLHSRLANRVFCEVAQGLVDSEESLYQAVYQIEWERHFNARDSIAVAATLSSSNLKHTHYAALKAKDAIVDRFREIDGSRPSVQKQRPDIQLHINIHRNQASISIDLSGESLHRRGYRRQHTGAPLKEHLAAALLNQAGWNREQAGALRLLDPMCGSGSFAIEAAMIAANIAPGLERGYFGFNKWREHDAELWQDFINQARAAIDPAAGAEIYASDYDAEALKVASANAERAGVTELIQFSHQQVAELEMPVSTRRTLVICNPPYGKRLQSEADLGQLHADLGMAVQRLAPARLAIISANPNLLHRLQLKRLSRKDVRNGPLDCLFAIFESTGETTGETIGDAPGHVETAARMVDDAGAIALRNRLAKNSKHLQRWARRNNVSCYRLYDADLPEFSFALDRYQSEIAPELEWFHLQEYQAPATIEADKAAYRINLAVEVVKQVFAIADDRLYCKIRSRQRGSSQYQKQDNRNEFFQVREGPASLLINLSDYLDSGLFLDHRITREMIYRAARDKSVLNLFCYTGTVGVYAGLGGASSVLNVDLSATYLDWARENHLQNGLDDETRYRFLRADILELINNPARFSLNRDYDLIFLDPPSFSNSKKMQHTLDIQRDHENLITAAMKLLAPQGLLFFSINRRGFKLVETIRQDFDTRDISAATIPEDFKKNQKIHRCWEIRRRAE